MFIGREDKTATANPFQTFSNAVWPNTVHECMKWATWLYNRNDTYRKAIQNVVRYFINGLSITQRGNIKDTSSEKIGMATTLFEHKYKIIDVVRKAGEEQAAIGIVFISRINRLSRELVCPKCGRSVKIEKMTSGRDYTFKDFKFYGVCHGDKCPSGGSVVQFIRRDMPPAGYDKMYFKIWPQEDISIRYNQITGKCKYYYRIPEREANAIRRGDDVYLEDTPWAFIEAVKDGGLIELNQESLLVLKNDTLAILDKMYKGWSVPLFLPSFPKILQMQLLERFNEAVVMDYIVPIRLISPPADALKAGADGNRAPINGMMFRNQMLAMVNGARGNPTQWVVSPVPVQYQMIGGEAKNLAPVDMLEWKASQLLSGMNIPMEFRQTSFQMVGPTLGLRMFERTWIHFANNLDKCAQWCADQICIVEQKDPFEVKVNKTSFVEDENNKQTRLSLASAGAISQTTGLAAVGLDYEDELRRKMTEEQMMVDVQREQAARNGNEESIMQAMTLMPSGLMQAMNQQQAAMQGGGEGAPAAPAAPMAPGGMPVMNGGAPDSGRMDDLMSRAEQIADQIWASPDRNRAIRSLNSDPALHDMVVGILERRDQQAASQGLAAAKQGGM